MLMVLCEGPGLNAMANHGYLPHNGIGSMEDFINGTAAVFGMGMGFITWPHLRFIKT